MAALKDHLKNTYKFHGFAPCTPHMKYIREAV